MVRRLAESGPAQIRRQRRRAAACLSTVQSSPSLRKLVRSTRAGVPPIRQPGGNSPLTTAPAATMDLLPMTVPPRIVAPVPIQQPSPITMGSEYAAPATWGPSGLMWWEPEAIVTRGPMSHDAPMLIGEAPPTISNSWPSQVSAPTESSPLRRNLALEIQRTLRPISAPAHCNKQRLIPKQRDAGNTLMTKPTMNKREDFIRSLKQDFLIVRREPPG
jgi:hypothetical protein